MLRLVCVFSLIVGLAAVSVRSQSRVSPRRNPDSIPADAVIALTEYGLLVRILADGSVMVEGEAFDFDIGRIKMQVDRAEVKKLTDEFERIGYFSLNDRYYDRKDGCVRSGSPATFIAITISFTLNGKSKSITHLPYECLETDGSPYPRDLVGLEKQIEGAVDLKRRR